jgi:hypothetical protein
MLPDSTTASEYGLPFSDYDTDGPIDPTTEQTAAAYEKHAVDVVALTHVAPRAIVRVDVAGGALTVTGYRSVWGDDPAIYPAVTYTGVGIYALTWAVGGYPDLNPTVARRVTRAPNFLCATVTSREFASRFGAAICTPNAVGIHIYNDAGAAADANFVLVVY